MFEPGTNQRLSYCHIVFRFRFSILFGHALRPVLMQSEKWIEKAGLRSETKIGFFYEVEKAP